jgi:hypothetical protein
LKKAGSKINIKKKEERTFAGAYTVDKAKELIRQL